ncbi:MAG TPA: PH domain-containing protein [Solirubrobacteraceae bacterium]|nr:PH domain-containing protein [Solirubrobacteraceae bacterium]
MDLHPGEEIVFQGRPVWRSLMSFYISATLGALVVGVLVGIVVSTGAGVLVFLVLFALALLVGFLRRVATVYTITNQRLRIQTGLLARRVQQTRIDRVQNVNTSQTMVDRVLRVGAVDFDTAGTDDSEFRFVGVSEPPDVVAAVDRAQREAAAAHGGRVPGQL